jgi:hypothetical protein
MQGFGGSANLSELEKIAIFKDLSYLPRIKYLGFMPWIFILYMQGFGGSEGSANLSELEIAIAIFKDLSYLPGIKYLGFLYTNLQLRSRAFA